MTYNNAVHSTWSSFSFFFSFLKKLLSAFASYCLQPCFSPVISRCQLCELLPFDCVKGLARHSTVVGFLSTFPPSLSACCLFGSNVFYASVGELLYVARKHVSLSCREVERADLRFCLLVGMHFHVHAFFCPRALVLCNLGTHPLLRKEKGGAQR
uniref:Uncharacterized protein TCIL3000_8_2640 n=1 Tax=Trypanosoma congolense (strain IL3000) TaxID=1068625 RepID=G0URN3_TRYCI|nr:unnamed protein product [Trypanosoma congolense IL3000]